MLITAFETRRCYLRRAAVDLRRYHTEILLCYVYRLSLA